MEAIREAHPQAPGVGGTALRRAAFSRSRVSSKRWWRARAACTGVRSSSTASWAGRYGPLRSCWRGTTSARVEAIRSLGPDCLPHSCPTARGGVELLARLPVCDLPQESIGFRKPLREPRSVGPKGRYDVLRKRAAPRCPRRILLRRDTKTTDVQLQRSFSEASAKLQRRRPEHCVELARPGPKALRLRATRRQSAPRHARRAA